MAMLKFSDELIRRSAATAAARESAAADPLVDLDNSCIAAYGVGLTKIESSLPPVLFVGELLTLQFPGQAPISVNYTPALYNVVKSTSHLLLGVVSLLAPYASDTTNTFSTWGPPLLDMYNKAGIVLNLLPTYGLPPESVRRNQNIITTLMGFITKVYNARSYRQEDVANVAHPLAPLALANANDAAKAQIDLMGQIVAKWKEQYPSLWPNVQVVIEVAKQPSVEYLQTSYFYYSLGDDLTANDRILQALNIFDDKTATVLLGSIKLDSLISQLTFNQVHRLERDLLGDAATHYLLEIFGTLGT
jgi:hypothetical protein